MRRGTNPKKASPKVVNYAPKLTVVIVVHIPQLSGYWLESLKILKICISSILENTQSPFELFIFDNASCNRVKKYLIELQGKQKIQRLILSAENLGKNAAWNAIFPSVQSEFVAYADSDVYFYEKWDLEHLKIFKNYPEVGMVSGVPVREKTEFSTLSTKVIAENHPEIVVSRGKFIDFSILEEFRKSIGKNPLDYQSGTFADLEDLRLELNGVVTFVGASHFQFMSKSEVLRHMLPLPQDKLIGNEKILDLRIDKAGLMRLSTKDRFVHHMGNSLVGDEWYRNLTSGLRSTLYSYSNVRILSLRFRSIFLRVYQLIFRRRQT